ncbi:helix-turn-helix domain-containing protein [Amnibacterium setariae]|nr:XRE family transcriptional regulator [Amnibacterium setariae]
MNSRAGLRAVLTEREITTARIGAQVRSLRVEREWSVTDFALRVGVAPHVVAGIEDGSRLPTVELLYRLAGALPVAAGDLLPGADLRPRAEVLLPLSDAPGAPVVQVIGGGPGNPTQTYLFDLAAGESDGGFSRHPGEELLVVMEGEVVCSILDGPDVRVRAGRSHAVRTDVPHAMRASDAGPARFLLVCTDACRG